MNPGTATEVVRECLGQDVTVRRVRELQGGMVSQVQEWLLEGTGDHPESVVVKVSQESQDPRLRYEHQALGWLKEHTQFPVPTVYGFVTGLKSAPGSFLLMEKLKGRHLGDARLTQRGLEWAQREMADHVARLHDIRGDYYGTVVEEDRCRRWLDWFRPRLEDNFRKALSLSERSYAIVERLLLELEEWLPEVNDPRVVHGDLWATNIMLDDSDPDRPRITGFIDGHALLADTEYELAYLLVFHTGDQDFFDQYTRHHPLRPGFERRCRVYWLNTLLLHVWRFGDEYLPRTERLVREVEGWMV